MMKKYLRFIHIMYLLLLVGMLGCGEASKSADANSSTNNIGGVAITIEGEVDLEDGQIKSTATTQGQVELFTVSDSGEQKSTGKTSDVNDKKYSFTNVDSALTYIVGYKHGSDDDVVAQSLIIIDSTAVENKKIAVKTNVESNYLTRYFMKEVKAQGLTQQVDKDTLKTFISVIETVVTQLVNSAQLANEVTTKADDIASALTKIGEDNGAKAVVEEVAVNRIEKEYNSKKLDFKEVSKDTTKAVLESEDGRFKEEQIFSEDGSRLVKSIVTVTQPDGQTYTTTREYDEADIENKKIKTKKVVTPKKSTLSYSYESDNVKESNINLEGGHKVVNKFESDGSVDIEEFTNDVLVKTKKRAVSGKEELKDIFDSISDNQLAKFKLHIETKDKLTAVNEDKKTPLYLAIEKGRLDMVDLLIKKSVDINKKEVFSDSDDLLKYPLYAAVKTGRNDMAQKLLENGAREQSDKGELLSLLFNFSQDDYRSKAKSFITLFKEKNISKESLKGYLEKDFQKLTDTREISDAIIDTLYGSISKDELKDLYNTFQFSDIFYTAYLRKRGLDLSKESVDEQQDLFERSAMHLVTSTPISEQETKDLMTYLVSDLKLSPDFQTDSEPPLLFKISQKPFGEVQSLMGFFVDDLKADIATKNKGDNRGLLAYLAARHTYFPAFNLSNEKVTFLKGLGASTFLPHNFGGRPLIDNVDGEGKVNWVFEWEPVKNALKYEIKISDPDNNTVHTNSNIFDALTYKLNEKIDVNKLTGWTWTVRPFVNSGFQDGQEKTFDVKPLDTSAYTRNKTAKQFVTFGDSSQCPIKQTDLQFSTTFSDPYNIVQSSSDIIQLFYDDVVYCVFAFQSNSDHLVIVGYDKNKDKTVRLEKSGPRYIKDILIHKTEDKIRFIGRENKYVDVPLEDLKVD